MALTLSRRRPSVDPQERRRPTVRAAARRDTTLDDMTIAERYQLALHGLHVPGLTASGLDVTAKNAMDIRRLVQPWQARSMSYFDLVPEVKFAARFMGALLSRVRLYPAMLDDDTQEPEEITDTSNPVYQAFARIQDRNGGRAQLQKSYGMQKWLIGETYLTVSPDHDRGEVWECLSPNELRVQPGGIATRFRAPMLSADQYKIGEIAPEEYVVGNAPATVDEYGEVLGPAFTETGPDVIVVYRLWRQHPAYSWLADSNMMACLDLLEELVLSTYSVRAQLKSRLNQGGILAMPEEMSFPSLGNNPDEDPNSDLFQERFTQLVMQAIGDPGSSAAFAPLIVQMAGEFIKDIKLIKFNDSQGDLAEISQRTEMVERYGVGAELPPELFKSQADLNHWCVDEETEILTIDRGFVGHDALAPGDVVLTLNHETGLSEWQPVGDEIYQSEVEDEEMISVEGRYHSSLTTLQHKWPVIRAVGRGRQKTRAWAVSESFTTSDQIIAAAPCNDVPTEPVYDDAFVELVAWLYTEGSVRYRPGRTAPQVAIWQSHEKNPENVASIRRALEVSYGTATDGPMGSGGRGGRPYGDNGHVPKWREVQRDRGGTAFYLNVTAASPLVAVAPEKVVTREFVRALTADQLELFVEVSLRADNFGDQILGQRDSRRLVAFELACILLGRPVSTYTTTSGVNRGTQWVCSYRKNSLYGPRLEKHAERRRYTGIVWCPQTLNHTICVRRHGHVYFTGQTGWLVDEQTWRSYGHPAALEMADDWCGCYLQPLIRDTAPTIDWTKVCIGIDPAEVITHPNRAKDAADAFDRLQISGKVYREVIGFNDNDTMSQDEKDEQAGLKIRDGSLYRYGIPAVRANIEPAAGEVEGAPDGSGAPVADPATGGKNPPGPPAEKVNPQPSNAAPNPGQGGTNAGPAVTAASGEDRVQQLLTVSRTAVHRGREMAGARLVSMVTGKRTGARCDECVEAIADVEKWDVAATLGDRQVNDLFGPISDQLVKGTGIWLAAILTGMGVPAARAAEAGQLVERHTAGCLYQPVPDELPSGFVRFLSRLHLPAEQA